MTANEYVSMLSDKDLKQCVEDLVDLHAMGTIPLDSKVREVMKELEDKCLAQPGSTLIVTQVTILQEGAMRWLRLMRKG